MVEVSGRGTTGATRGRVTRREMALRQALYASTALVAVTLTGPIAAQQAQTTPSAQGGAGGADYGNQGSKPAPVGGTSGQAGGDATYRNPTYGTSDGGAGGGANARGGYVLDGFGNKNTASGGQKGVAGTNAGRGGDGTSQAGYGNGNASGGGG